MPDNTNWIDNYNLVDMKRTPAKVSNTWIKAMQKEIDKAAAEFRALSDKKEKMELDALIEMTSQYIGKHIRLKKGTGSYPLHEPMNMQYMFVRKVDSGGLQIDTFYQKSPARFCFEQDVYLGFKELLKVVKKTDIITSEKYKAELKRYVAAAMECCDSSLKTKRNYKFGTLQKPEVR